MVVATSNLAPERLYEHGLQRELFLPFIALLKGKLCVLEVDGGRDWRLARLVGKPVYHHLLGPAAHEALAAAFADLTDDAPGVSMTLPVKGRSLVVPCAARRVAWFDFTELCQRPLAAADYLAIAEHFAAVIVEGIPRLSPGQRDAAPALQHPDRRTLRGAHHSAAVPPEAIYVAGAAPSDSSAPFLG